VRRQQPGCHRLATLGFISKLDGEAAESLRDVALNSGVRDVVDNPIPRHHVARFVLGCGDPPDRLLVSIRASTGIEWNNT
jgi:hypothetical protein